MKALTILAPMAMALALAAPFSLHAQSYDEAGAPDLSGHYSSADDPTSADTYAAEQERQVKEDDAIRQARADQRADDQLEQSFRDTQAKQREQEEINDATARARFNEDYNRMLDPNDIDDPYP